jgi:hypothetical protein
LRKFAQSWVSEGWDEFGQTRAQFDHIGIIAATLSQRRDAPVKNDPTGTTPTDQDRLATLLRHCGTAGIAPDQIDAVTREVAVASLTDIINAIEVTKSIIIGEANHTAVDLYRIWIQAHAHSHLAFAAWFNLGTTFDAAGERANAITAYRKALALRPGFRPAATNLGLDPANQNMHPEAPSVSDPTDMARAVRKVTQQEILDLVHRLRPWSMAGGSKVRLGNLHDGGYVVPAMALDCDAVLSIGIGGDVSFDLSLADLGARILQFDHTVDQPPIAHSNFTFYKFGWGPRSEGPLLGFGDMVAKLAAFGAHNPLLKFDIEGAEYAALDGVETEHLARFCVIVCEFHDMNRLTDPAFYDCMWRGLDKLMLHHIPVHLHANNGAGVVLVHGVPMPQVLELTLLRRELDKFSEVSREPIPGPLDRPNVPGMLDICMNPF